MKYGNKKISTKKLMLQQRVPIDHEKTKQYFLPMEVVTHNNMEDCWVSLAGKVLNITQVLEQFKDSPSIKPLLAFAGKDISHWFDEEGQLLYCIHNLTGFEVPYQPHGRIPEVAPFTSTTRWTPQKQRTWWNDPKYQVGYLTKKARPIRIVNLLIRKEVKISVCEEDTFYRIAERYSIYNKDCATSYIWKYEDRVILMHKTLDENGILDLRDKYADFGMPTNYYIPLIKIFYTDDFSRYEDDYTASSLSNIPYVKYFDKVNKP